MYRVVKVPDRIPTASELYDKCNHPDSQKGVLQMKLDAISDFISVVRHGGFGKAARVSHRPKPTLSRRVRELEDALGVRLLDRGNKAIRLTDEGVLLYDKAKHLLGELDDLLQSLKSSPHEPQGNLRITAPVLFSAVFLGRIAAGFAKAYPRVTLDIVAEDRRADLIDGGYDAAIRINPRPDSELVGKCFARDDLLLVAAPGVQRPCADAPHDVPAIVTGYEPDDEAWTFQDGKELITLSIRVRLRLSSMLLVRDAVLSGAGIALLPRSLAEPSLRRGDLVIWGKPTSGLTEIWVLYSSRRLESARLRAFIRFLEQSFSGGHFPVE